MEELLGYSFIIFRYPKNEPQVNKFISTCDDEISQGVIGLTLMSFHKFYNELSEMSVKNKPDPVSLAQSFAQTVFDKDLTKKIEIPYDIDKPGQVLYTVTISIHAVVLTVGVASTEKEACKIACIKLLTLLCDWREGNRLCKILCMYIYGLKIPCDKIECFTCASIVKPNYKFIYSYPKSEPDKEDLRERLEFNRMKKKYIDIQSKLLYDKVEVLESIIVKFLKFSPNVQCYALTDYLKPQGYETAIFFFDRAVVCSVASSEFLSRQIAASAIINNLLSDDEDKLFLSAIHLRNTYKL